jgi:hypothetical protein
MEKPGAAKPLTFHRTRRLNTVLTNARLQLNGVVESGKTISLCSQGDIKIMVLRDARPFV